MELQKHKFNVSKKKMIIFFIIFWPVNIKLSHHGIIRKSLKKFHYCFFKMSNVKNVGVAEFSKSLL